MNKIIIGVFVIILLYILYLYFFSGSSTMLVGMRDTSSRVVVSSSAITPGTGALNFTYSIWIFVTEWSNSAKGRYVFYRPANNESSNETSVLEMKFDNMRNDVNISLDTGKPALATCSVENVPLQSWTNIILTLNDRALDLYLDGKLVRTCVLDNVPGKLQTLNTDLVMPGSGDSVNPSFKGYTSNFKYIPSAVNPREAYAIYREGFGSGSGNWLSGMFNRYRIKMSFLEDNVEVNSFEL
jgi:hypothetical protein